MTTKYHLIRFIFIFKM